MAKQTMIDEIAVWRYEDGKTVIYIARDIRGDYRSQSYRNPTSASLDRVRRVARHMGSKVNWDIRPLAGRHGIVGWMACRP